MKILILTGTFYPELHPRAFRANELAINFAEKGHDVTVYNLRTIKKFDYQQYSDTYKIKIKNLDLYGQVGITREINNSHIGVLQKVIKLYRFVLDYFLSGRLFIYSKKIVNQLPLNDNWDLIISLSTPFMNHFALAIARRKIKSLNTVFIADSGDPFYRSKQTKRAPYFYFIEKFTYKQFDYLTIPSENAKNAYKGLISPQKIKIIPQGYKLNNIQLANYSESDTINFAYAGVFYHDIRNPKFLFDFLLTLKMNFHFYVYLRYEDPLISSLLKPYSIVLDGKITVIYGTERNKLLYELSKMDFLINIENTTSTQIPSKIIDYAITKRPIFSCSSKNFDKEKFIRFIHRDYNGELKIDLNFYDINNVTDKFLKLAKKI